MKKALLVLMALLVPFSSLANIFQNGDVRTTAPEISDRYYCQGSNGLGLLVSGGQDACVEPLISAFSQGQDHLEMGGKRNIASSGFDGDTLYVTYEECFATDAYNICYDWRPQSSAVGSSLYYDTSKGCPNEEFPDDTFSVDFDGVDGIDACANPDEIALHDSCDINDSLNVQTTVENGCYTKSDGSQCSVSAVDVGGGNSVYMGSEGNCYSEPKPDVTGNDTLGDTPDGDDCVNNGGLLACPEDPSNVCGDSGSNYGGGSVNNCQSGCGYVNDSFMCYDTDIDSDGLPDYNDPDIDGDGIPNDSDLDSDGDGKDDPINGGGGGGGGAAVDMSGVIKAIKDLKDTAITKQEIPDGQEIKELLETKNTDLETKTDEFFENPDLIKIDKFVENNGVSADFFQIQAKMAGTSCTNPSHPALGEFDLCNKITKIRPFLYILFGLGTFIFLVYRFTHIIRGKQ